MKGKLITGFLILALMICAGFALAFVREKRIHNLNVFKPHLYGTVSQIDDTMVTVDTTCWVDGYERIDLTGKILTFDSEDVVYPDGNQFRDGLSVGDPIYLVVDGQPYEGNSISFQHIYFGIEPIQ